EMRRIPPTELSLRVSEALDMVRMSDRAGHKPNQLSGGQQQRVALARALVIRPQCLLLDEPLSNLDARLRLDMRTEIRRICKDAGITTIYVTHDQKEALSMADRMAVMNEGRIQQVGTPHEVYLRPTTRFVAGFVGETNFLQGNVTAVSRGSCRVLTAIGSVTGLVPPDNALRVADVVTLSLRPEVLRLGSPPADAPNVFHGVAHDTVYLGEIAQHQVNVPAAGGDASADDTVLKVFELNPKLLARDTREDTHVWVDPEDVVVLVDT
ncbi:MAG: ABC transporter ATP-binding protein, partial [Lentisphaerae bacterium]|nr:ABC transporter ATP-binding protein [Lentisphaerota bacterium]